MSTRGMTARPAKRQRTLTVLRSPDNEPEHAADQRPQLRNSLRSTSIANEASTSPVKSPDSALVLPTRSPSKPKKPKSSPAKNGTRPSKPGAAKDEDSADARGRGKGSLYTFFTPSAQQQQSVLARRSPEVPVAEDEEDFIQDDSLDEDMYDIVVTGAVENNGSQIHSTAPPTTRPTPAQVPTATQKFVKIARGSRAISTAPAVTAIDGSRKPWAEEFAPADLDELAVHKNKVADVRRWLEAVMSGRDRKRLLILKGTSGTGKTTTISLLSEAMDFDVLEWRNPTGTMVSADGYASMSAQFEEFVNRGGTFGSLDVSSSDGRPHKSSMTPTHSKGRIILVEEFPNTFASSSTVFQSFRSTVQSYLASSTPSAGTLFSRSGGGLPVTPLVMIISETLLTTTSASADSFTAHRLLGPEILTHPGTTVMEFNPIARTLLSRAIELIIHKEARRSGRKRTVGPSVLDKLATMGDVRSAVGSLEFLCLGGDDGVSGEKVTFGKRKKRTAKDAVPLSKTERESLEMVTQREASLGLFHAVGKVVYNKREAVVTDLTAEGAVPNPPHLRHYDRPLASLVQVDTLIDETGNDTQTFLAALHENFILSCSAPTTDVFLESATNCIDKLSDSDLLCPSSARSLGSGGAGASFGRGGTQGAGVDNLRQDEMSFQVAVRGTLLGLPYPVKRTAPPPTNGTQAPRIRGGKSDAFKMFYPASLRLWRKIEEVESIIDLWATRLTHHDTSVASLSRATPAQGTVESWASNAPKFAQPANETPSPASLSSSASAARREMLLDRLPYLAQLVRHQTPSSPLRRQLETVIAFRGIEGQGEDIPDDDAAEPSAHSDWATDRATEPGSSPERVRNQARGKWDKRDAMPVPQREAERGLERLVLSDDDIVDD